MAFNGFTPATISFLRELASNNNKEWFKKNRNIYQEQLFIPLKSLASDLGDAIRGIDSKIDITPQLNKTISRIYRDTRFSADKSPYRTDQWLSFKRPVRIFGNVPEFFFYFTPEDFHIGMGFYAATPANMESIRRHIDTSPGEFGKIISLYEQDKEYHLYGDSYKKLFANTLPENYQQWYQKKSLYLMSSHRLNNLFYSPGLKNELEKGFMFNASLYKFIISSLE